MKRAAIAVAMLLVGLCAAPAWGQPVFFDDFDGDDLLPHWGQVPAYWEYNVGGGMLNVTGLFFPSQPTTPHNLAWIEAGLPAQGNFQVDVWMGWDEGLPPQGVSLQLGAGPVFDPPIATVSYWNTLNGPIVSASAYLHYSPTNVSIAGPPAGIHRFTISRMGNQFEFSVNGEAFANLTGTAAPASLLGLFFYGPYPGELGTLHVDRIQIVPAPGAMLLLTMMMAATRRRRGRG